MGSKIEGGIKAMLKNEEQEEHFKQIICLLTEDELTEQIKKTFGPSPREKERDAMIEQLKERIRERLHSSGELPLGWWPVFRYTLESYSWIGAPDPKLIKFRAECRQEFLFSAEEKYPTLPIINCGYVDAGYDDCGLDSFLWLVDADKSLWTSYFSHQPMKKVDTLRTFIAKYENVEECTSLFKALMVKTPMPDWIEKALFNGWIGPGASSKFWISQFKFNDQEEENAFEHLAQKNLEKILERAKPNSPKKE